MKQYIITYFEGGIALCKLIDSESEKQALNQFYNWHNKRIFTGCYGFGILHSISVKEV